MTNSMTRRAAFMGTVASTVALAIPAAETLAQQPHSTHGGDTALLALCAQWRDAWDACTNLNDDADDAPEWERLRETEHRVAAIRPVTAEGFAAKLLCLTSFFDFGIDDQSVVSSVRADAQALAASVGFVRPATMIHNLND